MKAKFGDNSTEFAKALAKARSWGQKYTSAD